MASPISTKITPYKTVSLLPNAIPQQILKDKNVRVILPGQPIPGQKDIYLIKTDINRVEAEEILKQTGLEIAFAPGENVRKDFNLGRGAFGTFCVGYATQKAHYVGIKITRGGDAAEAEVRIQEELSQLPHIMPSLDYCLAIDASQEKMLYQVMHLAGLGSVAKISPSITALDDALFKEQVFFVLAQAIFKGLDSMHQNKSYHLDLKPDNLVVNQKGDIFLIDFGCSTKQQSGLIDAEIQIGDSRFFSPERLFAADPMCRGEKVDMWAAGLTLLSVATNTVQPQLYADEAMAILEQLHRQFPSLVNPDPTSFWGLVKSLLTLDPKQRPTALEAMSHAWYVEKEKTASQWKQLALDHLREMVQALQREKRSLPIERAPELKGAASVEYKRPESKGSDSVHYKRPAIKSSESNPYKRPNNKDLVVQPPVSAAPKAVSSFNVLSPQDLPLPHFADFIERTSLQQTFLGRLKTDLKGKPSSILACAGLGGSGKSQLVTYMLHKVKDQYGLKLYFRSSDQRVSLETQHLVLARELGLTDDRASLEKAVEALHKYFANLPQPCLIVYDNADDPDVLRPFLPPVGSQVILTTRSAAWENPIEIGPFSAEEGKELVEKLLQRGEPMARLLCEELGYLPLAIVQACAYIRNQQLSVKSYIEKLQSMPQMLQEDQKLFGKKLPTSMGALWNITFETLRRESPQALKLLDALAYLSPDGIPPKVLDALDKTNAKEMLLRYALLQSDPSQSSFFIHRLLQRVVRAEKNASQHQENLDNVMQILNSIYVREPDTLEERKTNHLLVPQGDSLLSHYDRLLPTAYSELLVDTLLWVANGHNDQGNPKRNLEVLERAVLVAEAIYGKDHSNVATSLNNLGDAWRTFGDTKKAIEYHERALAIWQKTYGKEHPSVALSLSNLGSAWQTLGDTKKAIEYHERALAIKEKIYGKEHLSVAISLNNLGMVWQTLGDTKKAIESHEKALTIREKTYGKDHPSVANSLSNLGSAWQTLGDTKKAIEYHERALAIYQKTYGKYHPEVATSLSSLGVAWDTLGESKKAIEYHERALAIYEKTYGKDHPSVATSLNNLGSAWDTLRDTRKGIEYYERALAIYEEAYGKDHSDVATSLSNLGSAWDTLGDPKKAIEYHERAQAIREKTYGKDHPSVAISLGKLGNAWYTLGESEKAIEYMERALAINEKTYGKDHSDVATSLNNLGAAWYTFGDPKRAREYYERTLAIREKTYGKDHPSVATSLNNLGNAWDTLGDPKKAIEYHERALAIREKTYGKDHPDVATSLHNLGNAWDTLGDPKKAIEYYERTLAIREKTYGKDHLDVATTLNNLGMVWKTLGDPKKAIEYHERALVIKEKTYGKDHPSVATSLGHLKLARNDLELARNKAPKEIKSPRERKVKRSLLTKLRSLFDKKK